MAFERLKHFLDTFGQPRPPRPQIIPDRYRVRFFLGLSLLSLLVLLALIRFVLIPGIEAQGTAPGLVPGSVPAAQGSTP